MFLLRCQAETSPRPRCSSDGLSRGQGRLPHKITLDGLSGLLIARPVRFSASIPREIDARSDPQKYLNNLIEQGSPIGDQAAARSDARLPSVFGELQRRSPASGTHAPDQKEFSSNSANFASKTKPRLRFGMQCLARDPTRQASRELLSCADLRHLHHTAGTVVGNPFGILRGAVSPWPSSWHPQDPLRSGSIWSRSSRPPLRWRLGTQRRSISRPCAGPRCRQCNRAPIMISPEPRRRPSPCPTTTLRRAPCAAAAAP